MKIRITDWRCDNLRIGEGTEVFELGDPPARWSLVQMPNGLGKTSTMTLIRAVLGEEDLSVEKVRGFRANDTVESGTFELGLLIEGRGGGQAKHYRLTADFDFKAGTYRYSTLRAEERGGGHEPGLVLPSDLKHILKPEFIKLFVFDGELARDIRDLNKAAADHAIRTLYQLDDLSRLRQRIRDAVSKRQEALERTSGRTQKGVSRHQKIFDEAAGQLATLKKALAEKKSTRTKLKREQEGVRTQIEEHIARSGDLNDRRLKLSKDANDIASDIQTTTLAALIAYRNPATLSPTIRSRLTNLGTVLTKARLPKSVSSDFFDEIADEGECICGRPIGDAEREILKHRKEQYLAQDQISAIAAMKDRLNSSATSETSFSATCDTLHGKLEDRQANEKAMDRLKQEAEERGDEDMGPLTERESEINVELAALNIDIERLETADTAKQRSYQSTAKTNIPLAQKHLGECKATLDEVEASFRLSRQRDSLLDQLSRIEKKALAELREVIRTETNDRLKTLVKMEQLRVKRIDGALELESDKSSSKDDVSEGQSLSVAYAFLTALLSKAPFELPFIVDSPAVSLDLDVRKEVSKVIPTLFEQMIFFVISSEQAAFAESFYELEDTRFVTLSKTADGRIETHYGLDEFKRQSGEGIAE
ncbi:hypothetical protein [Rhizobium sp. L1K21]|uniref:hypothetical protein n=1 Tax=Rhizobium sp. L1K21 TaxID=2954933 RepID=UPI0020926EA9|nr:hypothetical protein [Rhizobium sp. L1K21]MCO6185214.1 hypothetical protein [Rhizobium sp. L1K21]